MDLERVRDFTDRRKELEDEIRAYAPGETGHEETNIVRRFENIWETLDILAGGQLDRSSIQANDGQGTSLTITRKARVEAGEHHSGLLHYANSRRSIEAQWISNGEEFPLESITATEVLGSIEAADASRRLGILEESVKALEVLLQSKEAENGLAFVASSE